MFFKRKHDFKPDRTDGGTLKKLYLTPLQRKRLAKWGLISLILLILSLLQDVVLSQVSISGATFALVPCGILLGAMFFNPDTAAVYTLVSSTLYYFSGTADGVYSIVLLTLLGTLLCIFRTSYLQRRFSALFLCAAVGILLYEVLVFFVGWFFDNTTPERFRVFLACAGLSIATMPFLYPIFLSVSSIGGETWKE